MEANKDTNTHSKITLLLFVILTLTNCSDQAGDHEIPNETHCADDSCSFGTVTDVEGNTYQWKRYGSQSWTTQNLRSTKYSDETKLIHLASVEKWQSLDNRTLKPAYSFFDKKKPNRSSVQNDEELPIPEYFHKETFGAYYTWAGASRWSSFDSVDVKIQGICPIGWHLPSKTEWDQLELFLLKEIDGYNGGIDSSRFRNSGITLDKYFTNQYKLDSAEKDGTDQKSPTTSKSRFEILPSGLRSYDGNYYNLGVKASFWTATLDFSGYTGTPYPNSRTYYYNESRDRSFSTPSAGMCVRCVKD